MNEFKFACPSCNQHVQIGVGFANQTVDCPSCKARLIVPAAPSDPGQVPVALLASAPASPAPAKSTPEATAPTPVGGQATGPTPGTIVAPINDLRVATLTPGLKLEIVRAARSRLAAESNWLPGKKGAGAYNYAARREGDQLIPVPPTDASATHLSLFGAILLEFHRHNVLRVTTGRRRFLDEELTAAIQQVLGKEPGQVPVSEAEREALTHPQCLAVLDLLETRYEREAAQARKKEQDRKIARVRMADLVAKIEKSSPVVAEEVACALYYELEEINQRLDDLEQNSNSAD